MPPNEADPHKGYSDLSHKNLQFEIEKLHKSEKYLRQNDPKKSFLQRYELVYWKVAAHATMNILGVYSLFNYPFLQNYKTTIWAILVSIYANYGIAAGAHRLWSHRSYKANAVLRTITALAYDLCLHMKIETFARLHRVHHKYTDTKHDPQDSSQGFFYCHQGWTLIKRPESVKEKFNQIDMGDVESDEVVRFTDKHWFKLGMLLNFISIAIPVYFWAETWHFSFLAQGFRFFYVSHSYMTINSLAHMVGWRPFDKNIAPTDNNWVTFFTNGEGWHNWHHTFPVDYKSAEIGGYSRYDVHARIIEFFARIGWAWDLKTSEAKLVKMVVDRKGDGSILSSMVS